MRSLYLAAIRNIEGARGQAFNIGGGYGNSLSLLELFSMLEEIAAIKLQYSRLPVRESDQRVFVSNIGKAKMLLGWEPIVSSHEGIERMLGWISEINADRLS